MKEETFAAIDIGSNTTKVNIAARSGDGTFTTLNYKDYPVPLIQEGAEKNTVPSKAIKECIAVLKEIQSLVSGHGVIQQKAISTEALRKASNREEVLAEIKKQTGIEVEVISEQREAELTLRAVLIDIPSENLVCINGGGGSTELCFHSEQGDRFFIFNFGAKNLTDNYIHKTADVKAACSAIIKVIEKEFNRIDHPQVTHHQRVVSVGGAIWAAASMLKKISKKDFDKLNKVKIEVDELESLVHLLKTTPAQELLKLPGAEKKRLEMLLAGILVHLTFLKLMNKSELIISTRSISDAVMLEFNPVN